MAWWTYMVNIPPVKLFRLWNEACPIRWANQFVWSCPLFWMKHMEPKNAKDYFTWFFHVRAMMMGQGQWHRFAKEVLTKEDLQWKYWRMLHDVVSLYPFNGGFKWCVCSGSGLCAVRRNCDLHKCWLWGHVLEMKFACSIFFEFHVQTLMGRIVSTSFRTLQSCLVFFLLSPRSIAPANGMHFVSHNSPWLLSVLERILRFMRDTRRFPRVNLIRMRRCFHSSTPNLFLYIIDACLYQKWACFNTCFKSISRRLAKKVPGLSSR